MLALVAALVVPVTYASAASDPVPPKDEAPLKGQGPLLPEHPVTADDSADAAAQARSSKVAVEDISKRSAFSSELRTPSGQRVQRVSAAPVHSYIKGAWVDTDLSLVAKGSSVQSKASDFPVTLSAGGEKAAPLT